MEKSKVYFTNFRATVQENIQQKLVRLMKTAGMDSIDFDKKYTAIKIHFGEPGNLAYLRPNYAKTVVDFVRSLGGKPFLTDCNTLYVGGRKNALDHLDSAYVNGFSPFSTGCHIIIADGLKGTDEVCVPVEGGTYVKEAKIGRAVISPSWNSSSRFMKLRDSAEPLRISVWAAVQERERWRCTVQENHGYPKESVSDAASVQRSVPMMRFQ